MNGQDFLRVILEALVPFLRRHEFEMDDPSISGRFYRVSFSSITHFIIVLYEPGDSFLSIMVGRQENKDLADIDDRVKTPRLADLNSLFMAFTTHEERKDNETFFRSILVKDREEDRLLKSIRELCLVLPKYLESEKGVK